MSQGEQGICELQRFDPLLSRLNTVSNVKARHQSSSERYR
jgi:hypothetical protein